MGEYTPQSRTEEILYDTIHSLEYTERPQSRIEELLLELKAVIEGGSGTSNYEELEHLPKINSVELKGDKSLSDLGAASEEAVAAKASQSDIAPTFSDATAYTAGDVVYYEGSLYRFTADHSAGAWDSADVESVTVDNLVDGLKPVDSITDGDMRPVTSNAVHDALVDLLSVQSTAGTEKTIEAGGYTATTINISKNGYTPLGIVGITSNSASACIYDFKLSGNSAIIGIRNVNTQSTTVKETVKVLYIKSS